MPEITVNGTKFTVSDDTTVAVAILSTGGTVFRRSVSGEPRGPLCGMGICYECRVIVDGQPHARSCQILCSDGMKIETA